MLSGGKRATSHPTNQPGDHFKSQFQKPFFWGWFATPIPSISFLWFFLGGSDLKKNTKKY
jgi:hypothetical protein